MARNTKQKREIANRRRKVADFLNRGIKSDSEIMRLLEEDHGIEVSRRTISYDKKAVHRQWLKDASQSIEEKQARVEAGLLYIHGQAIGAWLKSLQDEETTTEESAVGGASGSQTERAKVQTRRKGQSGNAALLGQARAVWEDIRKLRGLDATQEQVVNLKMESELAGIFAVLAQIVDEKTYDRILAAVGGPESSPPLDSGEATEKGSQ